MRKYALHILTGGNSGPRGRSTHLSNSFSLWKGYRQAWCRSPIEPPQDEDSSGCSFTFVRSPQTMYTDWLIPLALIGYRDRATFDALPQAMRRRVRDFDEEGHPIIRNAFRRINLGNWEEDDYQKVRAAAIAAVDKRLCVWVNVLEECDGAGCHEALRLEGFDPQMMIPAGYFNVYER